MPLESPVALLIYNRPAHTAQVLAAIAQVRPRKLFVVGDGPRADRAGDAECVAQTQAVLDQVDWPCEVLTNYAAVNLGCKVRVSSGLNWVFEHVPEAIVLEDDCVPDATFFGFCEQLLTRYRDEPRVHSISGTNFDDQIRWTPHSYYFSKYFLCWGWASWRRAWQTFDVAASQWPTWQQQGGLKAFAESPEEERYWTSVFDALHRGEVDSWARAFALAAFHRGGLHVIPSVNLVSNIGFGNQATHTTRRGHRLANLPARALDDLQHPAEIVRHDAADRHVFAHAYSGKRPSPWKRLQSVIGRHWDRLRAAWSISSAPSPT